MILSGKEILKHIGKEIQIEPFDENRLNPNSYNLSLANELLVYEDEVLDMKKDHAVPRRVFCWNHINYILDGRTNLQKQKGLCQC